MKECDVAIGVLVRDGYILICRRCAEGPFGGCWEFPGGKREGEEPLEFLSPPRTGGGIRDQDPLLSPLRMIEHAYPGMRVRLYPFLCD